VTEGLTLLPGIGVDKRTKEVFVVYLLRMTGTGSSTRRRAPEYWLLPGLQQCMSVIGIFPTTARAYSCLAVTANHRKARCTGLHR